MSRSPVSPERLRRQLDALLRAALPPADLGKAREAADLAEHVHRGQVRDDGTPYVLHPLRVAKVLVEELKVAVPAPLEAALLHDALEDDPSLSVDSLSATFGDDTVTIIRDITKPDRGQRSRKQANRAYFCRLQAASEWSKIVKLADKLDNVRDATNCPDPAKRDRTAAEARELFSLLCPTLVHRDVAAKLLRLLDGGLKRLERLG